MRFASKNKPSSLLMVLGSLLTLGSAGCYAPLMSPGIEARNLPEAFRVPVRTNRNRLNLAELTIPNATGQIGPGDLLSVLVHGLSEDPTNTPIQVRVLEDGTIDLPLVGSVSVGGRTLPMIRDELVREYEAGKFLNSAQVSVQLVEAATVEVVVMGEVRNPGVYTMRRNAADVGRAVALAGGMTELAGDSIEVHGNSQALFQAQAQSVQAYTLESQQSRASKSSSSQKNEVAEPPAPPSPETGTEMELDEPELEIPELDDAEEFGADNGDAAMPPIPDGPSGLTIPQASRRKRDSGIVQASFEETSQLSFGHSLPTAPAKLVTRATPAAVATPLIKQLDPLTVGSPPAIAPEPDYMMEHNAMAMGHNGFGGADVGMMDAEPVHTCIPLSGPDVRSLAPEEVRLRDGDVVTVPKQKDELFYVVGPLSDTNRTSFNVGTRDLRQIGGGFILPRDRDIDVITGVAMAGYIDPINSPTTATVHRRLEDGRSLLIRVDLIEARTDRLATVLLRPGDIVYLNPDGAWWRRRLFDQVAPEIFSLPWRFATQRWIVGAGGNGF